MPNLSDHDLRQMDEQWLERLPESALRGVAARLLGDLRQARDRLNQNPANSSRPSGSMAPWAVRGQDTTTVADTTAAHEPGQPSAVALAVATVVQSPASHSRKQTLGRVGKPGKPLGAKGFGRTQKLAHTETERHQPTHCAACGTALTSKPERQAQSTSWTGWDTLELVSCAPALGWQLQVTRHLLMQQSCPCGHTTRAQAQRAVADTSWDKVALGEQRLLGPRLAASIVYLSQRMRLSRRRVQELMKEFWGLELSTGLIDQTLQQTARAVEPLEDALVEELHQAGIVHVDETSWKEAGLHLWLWVFVSTYTVCMVIGSRAAEMFDNVLSQDFTGILMSDGYGVYRSRENRLRCWAHLLRKAQGLAESTNGEVKKHGAVLLEHLQTLKQAIYAARDADPPGLAVTLAPETQQALRQHCQSLYEHAHAPLRAFARELLLDWEVIMRPLREPHLELTNNAAERALRHHVIARRISHGTRTPQGSRGYALLASVIQTCQLRKASVIDMLASTIHAARKGLPLPLLPPIPVTSTVGV